MPTWSDKQLEAALRNPAVTIHGAAKPVVQIPVMPSAEKGRTAKYWNTKVYVYADGYVAEEKKDSKRSDVPIRVYDSRREYLRSKQLRLLERAGKIKNLKEQVRFELEPAGEYRGKKIRAEYYYADFTYIQNGELVVEDVKGFSEETQVFRTTELFRSKWNRLKRRHQEYKFILIDPVAGIAT